MAQGQDDSENKLSQSLRLRKLVVLLFGLERVLPCHLDRPPGSACSKKGCALSVHGRTCTCMSDKQGEKTK